MGDDRVPAERVDVVDGRHEAGEELVLARAELEAVADRLVRRRAGPCTARHDSSSSLLPNASPMCGPKNLYGEQMRTSTSHAGDVDRPVRPVVHRVGPRESTGAVGELDDAAHVRRRADRVRGDRERDDARPLGELGLEVGVVDLELAREAGHADDDPEVVGQLEPRRDVPVVVERRDDDLVALAQRPPERAGEEEVHGGHALAERGLSRRAAEEGGRALVGALDEPVRPAARLVRRADVGVVLAQVGRDGVDDLVRALRPARPVEEREAPVERGEARAHGRDVEQGGAHELTSWPLTIQRCRGRAVSELETKQPCSALRDELLHCSGSGYRCELDRELRLDVDEGVEPVVGALGHGSVCAARPRDVEPGAMCGVAHARERAAEEAGEHEVLCPPLVLLGERRPSERAASPRRLRRR